MFFFFFSFKDDNNNNNNSFGDNKFGQLSVMSLNNIVDAPTVMVYVDGNAIEPLAVACGGSNCCVIDVKERLLCSGGNENGQLGRDDIMCV